MKAQKTKKTAKPKAKSNKPKKTGRPSAYKSEYAEQAYKLCLMGAKDSKLADFFGVSESTLNLWKINHKEFSESLKAGKDEADSAIAESLYHRAKGYKCAAVKIVADAKTGAEHIVKYTEHYPPDTTACIFWLKNRQKDSWRDKAEIEHSGELNLAAILAERRKKAAEADEE